MESDSVKNALMSDSHKVIIADPIIINVLKRLYAIAPLFAMAFSTINQVFTIAKNVAAQSTSRSYNRDVEVFSDGEYSYYTCEYGDAEAVITYCPYDSIASFQGILSLWIGYFFIFMVLRLVATFNYSTNDLRFYIATDRYNGNYFNKLLVGTGLILTLISVIIALIYMTPQTDWNPTIDTNSALSIVVFLGINVVSLYGFLKMVTATQISGGSMSDFDSPIYFYNSKNGVFNMLSSVDAVLKPLVVAYMEFLATQDDTQLRLHGEPGQLKEAMKKLYLKNQ